MSPSLGLIRSPELAAVSEVPEEVSSVDMFRDIVKFVTATTDPCFSRNSNKDRDDLSPTAAWFGEILKPQGSVDPGTLQTECNGSNWI